jgi:hypothetical protein
MAIVRGETAYLAEWIDFHRTVGADHFLLYIDEDPGDFQSMLKFLKKWVDVGLITPIAWNKGQSAADVDSVQRYWQDTFWLARLDGDEYMYHPSQIRIDPLLVDIAKNPAGKPKQFLMARFNYGDDGHTSRPDDFLGSAYRQSQALPGSYKALVYTPVFASAALLSQVSGGPHKFVDEDLVQSCEGDVRLGPLLICAKSYPYVFHVGRPRALSSTLLTPVQGKEERQRTQGS